MGSKLQKAGLVLVLAAMAGYLGWRAWQAGGLEHLMDKLRETAPQPSESPTPSSSPVRTRTPAPVRTTTPTAIPPSPTPTGAAAEVVAAVNARRAGVGAPALTVNAVLAREAQEYADDLAPRELLDHTSAGGVTFQQRIEASGYPSGTVAENLGLTSAGTAASVVELWMGSPGHRTNMLNTAYRGVGIGVASGVYQGQPAVYVVAIFGAVQ